MRVGYNSRFVNCLQGGLFAVLDFYCFFFQLLLLKKFFV